jgi:hypothetical protein
MLKLTDLLRSLMDLIVTNTGASRVRIRRRLLLLLVRIACTHTCLGGGRTQGVLLLTEESNEESSGSSNNASEDSEQDTTATGPQLFVQARARISRSTVHFRYVVA